MKIEVDEAWFARLLMLELQALQCGNCIQTVMDDGGKEADAVKVEYLKQRLIHEAVEYTHHYPQSRVGFELSAVPTRLLACGDLGTIVFRAKLAEDNNASYSDAANAAKVVKARRELAEAIQAALPPGSSVLE